MKRWIPTGIVCVAAAAFGILTHQTSRTGPRLTPPQPINEEESPDMMQRRLAWIESLHNHAPGTDWRAMDAATRAQLAVLREQQTAEMARGIRSATLSAAPAAAIWREQGANNWAGRASAVDYDPATDRLTVFAHGGQLWRATRSNLLSWQSLNDTRYFKATGNAQNFVRLNGTPERFVAVDDSAKGIFYSDDDGKTWTASTGLNFANWNGTTYMVARDPGGTELYATVIDYNGNVLQVHLVESNDRGATWNDLGFINSPQKVALFAMGQGTSLVYLLNGNMLSLVNTGTAPPSLLTPVATISNAPLQAATDSVGLAGGMTGATPFFYAFFETNGTSTTPLVSTNGGTTWTPTAATIPAISYIRVAAGTSLSNSNIACYGSVELWCTSNGGGAFSQVNLWPDYYPNVATKLHADISFVKSYLVSGNEVFFIGTDGGIFESATGLTSVSNDNLTSLRDAQYYASYTGRSPPYALSIGAQDQGYQNNGAPATGPTAYSQLLSGDYADLTSSNGGATLWFNYPGSTTIDPAPASHALYTTANTTPGLPSFSFASNGLDQPSMLFFPPMLAMPGNPNSTLLSTAIKAGASDTFQITQLNWDGNSPGVISASNGTFNFGSNVTAIASDGATFYATANLSPGGAAFYSTTTPTGGWTAGATSLPQGQYLTGLSIVADPVRANTVYVGGSGYSNPGVYVSANGGSSFTAMSNGLPNTLVYALAITPDGTKLFAATEVGPYFADLTQTTPSWTYIGTGAPTNIFWNVEYVPALNIARFATYGRGIWDYDMGGGDLIFRNGFE